MSGNIADNSSSFTENGSDSCVYGYEYQQFCREVDDSAPASDAADSAADSAVATDEGGHGGPGHGNPPPGNPGPGHGNPPPGGPGHGEPGHGEPGHGGPGHGHHTVCETRQVAIMGFQYYTGTRHITDRDVSLKFVEPSSKETVATFSGYYRMTDYLSDKFYTSPCIR
jgi:hypothetical protein